jgi:predicted permease
VLAQLFTESMLLTVAGGTLGVLLSLAAAPTLLRFIPQPGFAPVTGIHTNLDWRVFGFTAAVCMTTGLLFGIGPAWLSTRVDLTGSLKSEAEHPSGWGRITTRKILVVLQVAVSIPLLLAAGLFVRTLSNLRAIDIGMAGQNVYLASVNPTLFGYKGQRLREFCDSLCTRVATLPGVRSASLADITPLSGSSWNSSVTVQGYTPRAHEGTVFFDAVGPRYFETIGTPILLGRDFTERDNPPQAIELPEHLSPGDKIPDGGGKRVAIVNEAFARHYFEDRSALGGQVTIGNSRPEKDFYEVVGVVKDARYFNVRNVAPPMVFVPVWRRFASERHLVIRSSNSPMQIETALRRELHKLDPAIPLLSVRTLAHDVDENILVERMVATLCAFFGALALALCAIGLYGVVAYTVTRRTREIGIRIAVGSPAQSVLWLVMREVIAMIFVGTALGGLAALLASHAIASVLFGVHTSDPVSLLAAGSCLTLAAVLASFFPARRAMRIDPMQALRYE